MLFALSISADTAVWHFLRQTLILSAATIATAIALTYPSSKKRPESIKKDSPIEESSSIKEDSPIEEDLLDTTALYKLSVLETAILSFAFDQDSIANGLFYETRRMNDFDYVKKYILYEGNDLTCVIGLLVNHERVLSDEVLNAFFKNHKELKLTMYHDMVDVIVNHKKRIGIIPVLFKDNKLTYMVANIGFAIRNATDRAFEDLLLAESDKFSCYLRNCPLDK